MKYREKAMTDNKPDTDVQHETQVRNDKGGTTTFTATGQVIETDAKGNVSIDGKQISTGGSSADGRASVGFSFVNVIVARLG